MMKRKNQYGLTMLEMIFSLIVFGTVLFGTVALTRGIVTGQQKNSKRDVAHKINMETMNHVLSHPWDEMLNDERVRDMDHAIHMFKRPIGPDNLTPGPGELFDDDNNSEIIDDLDDLDYESSGFEKIVGDLTTRVHVRYVDVSLDGTTPIRLRGDGMGTAAGQRSEYKRVVVETTWVDSKGDTQKKDLVTVVPNGLLGGIR